MSTQYVDIPGGDGVTSLNGLTGALTLVAGANITITPSGSTITIASTGGGGGITSINSDATAAQLLTIGTAGTDFAITDSGGGSHVFNLPTASASNRGALSTADWTTFNNKQPAGSYITALTGDGTAIGPGSAAFTLANTAVTASSYTLASITVDSKGRITAASSGTPGANTALSNLTSPTAINNSLIPGADGTIDLGTASTRFNNGWFANQVLVGSTTVGVRGYAEIMPVGVTGGTIRMGYNGTWSELGFDGVELLGVDANGYNTISIANSGTPNYRFFGSANTPIFTLNGTGQTLTGTITASNFSGSSSGTNTGDVTLSSATGLSLAGQVLSIAAPSTEAALGALTWSAGVAPSGTISKTYRYTQVGRQVTLLAKITATVAGTAVTAVSFPLPAGMPNPATWTTQESGGLITAGSGTVSATVSSASAGSSGIYDDGAGGYKIQIFDISALSATAAYCTIIYDA